MCYNLEWEIAEKKKEAEGLEGEEKLKLEKEISDLEFNERNYLFILSFDMKAVGLVG